MFVVVGPPPPGRITPWWIEALRPIKCLQGVGIGRLAVVVGFTWPRTALTLVKYGITRKPHFFIGTPLCVLCTIAVHGYDLWRVQLLSPSHGAHFGTLTCPVLPFPRSETMFSQPTPRLVCRIFWWESGPTGHAWYRWDRREHHWSVVQHGWTIR